jgi:hypothetical protein
MGQIDPLLAFAYKGSDGGSDGVGCNDNQKNSSWRSSRC